MQGGVEAARLRLPIPNTLDRFEVLETEEKPESEGFLLEILNLPS